MLGFTPPKAKQPLITNRCVLTLYLKPRRSRSKESILLAKGLDLGGKKVLKYTSIFMTSRKIGRKTIQCIRIKSGCPTRIKKWKRVQLVK